jgi:8-amino-7-oxononanoate synthase
MDLFEKCAQAAEYESGLKQSGHYCFFRKLESPQDSEVVINGKRVIMIGSNNYLGPLKNTVLVVRVHDF